MIREVLLILAGALVVFGVRNLIRNQGVYKLRKELIARCDPRKTGNWGKCIQVYRLYSYNEMMYSFRPISSFRKELFDELAKIKTKGNK